MNKLSLRSQENLSYCHIDLIKIVLESIKISLVDFGISYGHRTPETQFNLFKKGRAFDGKSWYVVNEKETVTNCDGYTIKSEHNNFPSTALDFFAVIPGFPKEIYNELHLIYIAATMQTVAKILYDNKEITHLLTSGANWNNDGVLKFDQKLQDLCHVQIYKPKI